MAFAGSSISGFDTWGLLFQIYLDNLPWRAYAVKASLFSAAVFPTRWQCNSKRPTASSRREANSTSLAASHFHVEIHLVARHFQVTSISQVMDEPGRVFLTTSFPPPLHFFSFIQSFDFFFYISYSHLQLQCSYIFPILKQAFILSFAL